MTRNDHSLRHLFLWIGGLYLSGALILADIQAVIIILTYLIGMMLGWHAIIQRLNFGVVGELVQLSPYEARLARNLCYLICVGILGLGWWRISEVGAGNYFFITRSARALITREDLLLSVLDEVLFGLFWAITALCFFENLRRGIIYWALFTILAIYSVVSISLASIVGLLIPLYLINNQRLNLSRWLWLFCLFGLFVSVLWKPLVGSIILGYQFDLTDLRFPAELTSWVNISQNIAPPDRPSSWEFPLLGKSFYFTIIGVLLPFYEIESLSVSYAKAFLPDIFYGGGGRGFSLPLEAFMNFWYFGPPLVGFFLGICLRVISNNSGRNAFRYFVMVAVAAITFKLFRSESYAILKNLVWLQIIPVFCVFMGTKLMYRVLR